LKGFTRRTFAQAQRPLLLIEGHSDRSFLNRNLAVKFGLLALGFYISENAIELLRSGARDPKRHAYQQTQRAQSKSCYQAAVAY
jgi:hypothetical protein